MRTGRERARGVSLIELVIAIVVISVAVTAVMATFSETALRSVDPMLEEQGIAIAEAYLEEITLQSFADPDGSEAGEVRATFDDVDDYDGLVDVGARDQSGTLIPGLEPFTVAVTVQPQALNGVPAADVQRIDVRVSHAAGRGVAILLSGYRVRE